MTRDQWHREAGHQGTARQPHRRSAQSLRGAGRSERVAAALARTLSANPGAGAGTGRACKDRRSSAYARKAGAQSVHVVRCASNAASETRASARARSARPAAYPADNSSREGPFGIDTLAGDRRFRQPATHERTRTIKTDLSVPTGNRAPLPAHRASSPPRRAKRDQRLLFDGQFLPSRR